MNEVCENRILYKYSANLGYYNEHLSNEARTYIKSIRNKTINLNNFIPSRNYLIVTYVYGVHCVVISPHFFPISFYLTKKRKDILRNGIHYHTLLSIRFLIYLITCKKLEMMIVVILTLIIILRVFGYALIR